MSEQPRALITGISGQDGSYLAEFLLEQGYEVWGVVRRSTNARFSNLDAIRDRITLVQGDVLDHMTMLDAITTCKPREIYNLAATSFVPASWKQPVMTAQFTAVGVTSMLEAIRLTDPGIRFYQASSSEMFGATSESPQNELTPFRPHTPYGVAKAYGHFMVASYRERYDMYACSGISFNHESPRRPAEFVTRKVSQAAAAIKLGLEREVALGNLDATRDWSYAGDQAKAMWLMLQQDEADDYVIASGISRSVRDLVAAAFGSAGLDWEEHVRVDPAFVRPPDPVALVGDPSKARERLGWQHETSFEEMLADMVEHDLRLLSERATA